VAARHAPNHAHAILRKSAREMYTSDATIHNRNASAIELGLGAPHGLGRVLTILLPEILIRHAPLPTHTASQRLCSPYHSPQCVRLTTTIGWLPSHTHRARHATIAPILPPFTLDSENGIQI
jgi:hypothetical protein